MRNIRYPDIISNIEILDIFILQEYRLLISPLPPPIEEEKKETSDDAKAAKSTKSTKAQVKKFDNR